jgi:hypothetical protein
MKPDLLEEKPMIRKLLIVVLGGWVLAIAFAAAASDTDWGPEVGGRRTRLVPLASPKKPFSLGQPMKFRLEMKNVGQSDISYDDQQVEVNNSMRVFGPDGKPVRYIDGWFQTVGETKVLRPSETTVLFDGLDLYKQYLIVKPGKYTVRFPGPPASNMVTIDVGGSSVSAARLVAYRLAGILPKGWDMTIHEELREAAIPGWEAKKPMSSVVLCGNPTGLKADLVWVDLKISYQPLTWTGKVEKPGDKSAVNIGKLRDWHVYSVLPSEAELRLAHWPTMQRDIAAVLAAH